jgi:hypothetical protein
MDKYRASIMILSWSSRSRQTYWAVSVRNSRPAYAPEHGSCPKPIAIADPDGRSWPHILGCPLQSGALRLRARLAPSGYQYLYQYPNTSFRIFRKTRLPCFRILTTNTGIQILSIRPHTNSSILELTYGR